MDQLIGEFDCKLDTKGRMVVPAALKRQLPDVERVGLVMNRGFEKNLVIYTREEWSKKMNQLAKLNQYNEKTRIFIRQFMRGATELTLDSAGRVLLPKSLLEYANIKGEVFLQCQFDKIELWAKDEYEKMMDSGSEEDFSALAEEVMGGFNFAGDGNE
ncbi:MULTISPECIES: division/cell wall cluster transcriptional repressor MraZ [Sphingobacterium]|uniref:Transcriptional regulator MraZ n=1 Tax=Sphingobacterium cellulitidis TaxID=1768011 RepID=A0A8H9G297_9SPHI|nr:MULTISPECIES: division/cell wall cluster transcriptional repressor MraZ [Sphingobacterium]MBA8988455.1 MraZ protein [Sphingobacterium soli]OYD43306.1 division/cell wall cluster transcriptional repressor MraZ [Sphingobacterium cellulitidis]OYD47357.1 division/cell wall cluster transcriptional repressor MraZ [Sphingobacterium cellulitidis]WFB62701.1 division/cell wall cluster transcriptional repressor MraZ [Sphingobacterium sp. WM]GGE32673.1 transcriptional regulator MraZ [Sphingobacterium so